MGGLERGCTVTRPWSRAFVGHIPQGVSLALRCATAAVVAWLLATPFGGVADEYRYYAPFGAVAAVSTTVMGSLRASLQVLAAFVLGAPLALLVQFCSLPTLVSIAAVAGGGTLLAQVRGLGAYGSWVPVSALFVLLIGHGQATHFTLGYLGMTMFGTLTGVAVILLLPPLALVRTERAQDALLDLLVVQLEDLADALTTELDAVASLPDRRHRLQQSTDRLRREMADALGGPTVNWRVRRTRTRADWLRERGEALSGLGLLVAGVAGSVKGDAAPSASWGRDVDTAAAVALRASATALRWCVDEADEGADDPERVDALLSDARAAVHGLTEAIITAFPEFGGDLFSAAALAEGLRRTHDTLRERTPREG